MMRLLLQWVLSALSLMMVAKLLPGFHIKDFGSALGVAAVYGIFHVVLYPVLLFVAFIPVLLSFGLFIFGECPPIAFDECAARQFSD